MKLGEENYNDGYYHLGKDLEMYPDAVVYIVFSNRGPGKTYSALRYGLRKGIQEVYMKRTNDDVDTICGDNSTGLDLSPYVPLNRDFDLNIQGKSIRSGIGGFWKDGDFEDEPICYCFSLNALKHIKGIECSNADIMVWDECVPTLGDIKINRKEGKSEGEQCLDIYESICRDRIKRGKKALKLVLLSNTDTIDAPIYNTLEVTDVITDMLAKNQKIVYLEDRRILIHHILPEEVPAQAEKMQDGMGVVMRGTAWYDKAYGGKFSNDDFSDIRTISLKGFRCVAECILKRKPFYIYYNPTTYVYYFCNSRGNAEKTFDFSKLSDRRAFADQYYLIIRDALMNHRLASQKYTYWDTIVNFTQKYKV